MLLRQPEIHHGVINSLMMSWCQELMKALLTQLQQIHWSAYDTQHQSAADCI